MQDIGTPDYSRIITKTKRVYRPIQSNIPNYINLNICKALICQQLMITDRIDKLSFPLMKLKHDLTYLPADPIHH